MERAPAKEVAKGTFLFHQGDPVDGIYAVEQGRLRLSFHSADGHEALVHVARVGDLIIESALFAGTYHCDAFATEDSQVRVLERHSLLNALRSTPKLSLRFMEVLAKQVRLLRARIENRNIRFARDRVIHYIITHGREGRVINLDGSLKELALDLGLSRESLSRILSQLKKDGTIERTSGMITLRKLVKLPS